MGGIMKKAAKAAEQIRTGLIGNCMVAEREKLIFLPAYCLEFPHYIKNKRIREKTCPRCSVSIFLTAKKKKSNMGSEILQHINNY